MLFSDSARTNGERGFYMIRTIVVDDEWYNRAEICDFIEKTGFMRVESCCQNGAEALREADRVLPQAAFIDIEMPEMDGLTLAEKLLEKYPEIQVVFITGWNQYAVAAFELNALDYIMKPLNKARFQKMVERLKRRVELTVVKQGNRISIRCFGGFDVMVNGHPVIWRRSKAEELFAFLLTRHDTFVAKEIIIENLWSGYEITKSLPILQTAVCKIRNIFSMCKSEVRLIYANNRYGIFLSDTDCDYLKLESMVNDFQDGYPKSFEALEKACETLQCGLFDGRGFLWSESCQEYLHRKLSLMLCKIADHYHAQNDVLLEIEACKQLSRFSPIDDEAQLRYISVLRARGRKDTINRHGDWLRKTLQEEYGCGLPDVVEKALQERSE